MGGSELAIVGTLVCIGACVQFLTGFGFSLTAVPLLALVIDVRTAAMLAAILAMFTSSAQAWLGRAVISWPTVRLISAWALLGMPFGAWLFRDGGERALKGFLGVSTLMLVVLLVRGVDLTRFGRHADAVASVIAGVLTTSINTNGPPMIFVLQTRKLEPAAFRATITAAFVLVGSVGLAMRLQVGGMTSAVWSALRVGPPAMLVGGYVGFRLRPKVDGERFQRAVQFLLVVAAVSAIATAI